MSELTLTQVRAQLANSADREAATGLAIVTWVRDVGLMPLAAELPEREHARQWRRKDDVCASVPSVALPWH
jgi:hypothetical protein